jgi:hypothetical protein
VFDHLIESKRKTNKSNAFGVATVSLVMHTVVIATTAYATLNAGQDDTAVKVDTALVFVDQPQQQKPAAQQAAQLDEPLKVLQGRGHA